MAAPAPTRADPAPPDLSAAYVVPVSRSQGLGTLLVGAAPLSFVIVKAVRLMNGQPVAWWSIGLSAVLAAVFLTMGLMILLRRRPAVAADGRGVWAWGFGGGGSFVPWDEVAGVECVAAKPGRAGKTVFVVLVGVGEPGPGVRLDPVSAAMRREHNPRYTIDGVLWIVAGWMGRPAEEVADRLRAMALAHHERAGPPGDGPD